MRLTREQREYLKQKVSEARLLVARRNINPNRKPSSKRLRIWEEHGLFEHSPRLVECRNCGKVTSKTSRFEFRHFPHCQYYRLGGNGAEEE